MTRSYLIRFQDDLLLSIRLPQSRVTLIYFILFHSNTLDFWIVVTGINCAMQWHRISVNLTLFRFVLRSSAYRGVLLNCIFILVLLCVITLLLMSHEKLLERRGRGYGN